MRTCQSVFQSEASRFDCQSVLQTGRSQFLMQQHSMWWQAPKPRATQEKPPAGPRGGTSAAQFYPASIPKSIIGRRCPFRLLARLQQPGIRRPGHTCQATFCCLGSTLQSIGAHAGGPGGRLFVFHASTLESVRRKVAHLTDLVSIAAMRGSD